MKYLVLVLLLTSCALPVTRHRVSFDKPRIKIPVTRAEKYLACVTKLSNLGIQQARLRELCDASYGKLE